MILMGRIQMGLPRGAAAWAATQNFESVMNLQARISAKMAKSLGNAYNIWPKKYYGELVSCFYVRLVTAGLDVIDNDHFSMLPKTA